MSKEPTNETRLRHQLNIQSRQINRVMSHHHVPAAVEGGNIHPRLVNFNLQTQISAGLERIKGLKDDLVSALGVGNVDITRYGDKWRLRVPRPDDPPVPLLRLLGSIDSLPSRTAAIGLAEGGRPVLLDFTARNTTHVLVAGDSGAGKTTLLRTIAVALALTNRQSDLQLQVLDAGWKGSDDIAPSTHPLMPLGYLPHMLADPALGGEASSAIVHFLAEEMSYRREQHVTAPRIVAILDNAHSLLGERYPAARSDLLRLLQYGAKSGIHVVFAAASAELLQFDSTIRAGLSMKLIGHLEDPLMAKRIAGMRLDQATLLYGEGDFLAVTGSEVTYFQAAHIGDYDLHLMLGELLDHDRPRLLARPYKTRPEIKKKPERTAKSFSLNEDNVALDLDEFGGEDPAG